MNFYEVVDRAFDNLYEKYGFNDDIIKSKQDLLHVYDNEKKWRSAEIYKAIKPKHWIIDEKGCIRSVP
jgi:hypothetical protein